MLLDNNNNNPKVAAWITNYCDKGDLDIVTGYFTVGALAYLHDKIHKGVKIRQYRFILGDITTSDTDKIDALDLLNENLSLENVLRLSQSAKKAVDFLKHHSVALKTLEPNFCHAKVYLFKYEKKDDPQKGYYITGSSNMTEAGWGLKATSNVELNVAGFSSEALYNELVTWFKDLWESPKAKSEKTVKTTKQPEKKNFKEYIIEQIAQIFKPRTPKEIYQKILYELFGKTMEAEWSGVSFNKQMGRLENTAIYGALYDFQKKGAISLIKMLEKYNGAILADAVGLGKTWTALAVMKYYQMQGREIILICPKKLEANWRKYRRRQNSKFEKDQFDFFIRFHTDLQSERMESYQKELSDVFFINEKPKLFVIDESHNLRNDKSTRYEFFLDEILKRNEDAKVLMLSATPINNSLLDIRNQLKLMVKGNENGFDEFLGVNNLTYLFRKAQEVFTDWSKNKTPKIEDFLKKLPPAFFRLTDALIVARTRNMVDKLHGNLGFPLKNEKPDNIWITPKRIGKNENFKDLFDQFPQRLSAYLPSHYIKQQTPTSILQDEQMRDLFLSKMMYILMVKRLESSWYSFHLTIQKIKAHHDTAMERASKYSEKTEKIEELNGSEDALVMLEQLEMEIDALSLGKKRPIKISEIAAAGKLDDFKKHLKDDLRDLQALDADLEMFAKEIKAEHRLSGDALLKSADKKLEALMGRIQKKRAQGANNGNPKVIIFTVYKDTAEYLFEELTARGFKKVAYVSGTGAKSDDTPQKEVKDFEPILERFAPFTKLFKEKEWNAFIPSESAQNDLDKYEEWKKWLTTQESAQARSAALLLNKPLDILIATDTLSEGQNLQDCDTVINYDIHWNPVRIIQRLGRVDRLGSPNKEVFAVNFWPSKDINEYLNLQERIEKRMVAMMLVGAEVDKRFTDQLQQMTQDESLETAQTQRMLEQMESSIADIDGEKTLGFDDLSLETYRQELMGLMEDDANAYRNMPNGVFSGFQGAPKQGIIALLGHTRQSFVTVEGKSKNIYSSYDLVYVDFKGKPILLNQKEILLLLAENKNKERWVSQAIDNGDETAIKHLSDALHLYLKQQMVTEDEQGNQDIGQGTLDILDAIAMGSKHAPKHQLSTDKFAPEKVDLIAWLVV